MRSKTQLASCIATGLYCLTFIAATGSSVSSQPRQNPAQAIADPSATGEPRFPVALQHSSSWCYGYLYVGNRVRFMVVQPQSDGKYSFDAPRSEVSVRQWIILGRPQDAIELKVNGATYHMRWLANEGEVNAGGARRWAPPMSQPPASLISAIQSPASASPVAGRTAGANTGANDSHAFPGGSNATDSDAGIETSPMPARSDPLLQGRQIPPGKLQGVYVCTGGANGQPTNKQFIFYPDGLMVYGIPEEGMLDFDFDHYRNEDNRARNWVGRYQADGDKVRIVWQNQFGDPARPALIKINEASAHPAWDAGWDTFIPMCGCTGKRLSGTYRWGAPAADQYLQFFPDGTFTDHRVTDQLIVPSRFYEHPRTQRGTYEIQRQTIIFTFADGHRGTRTFLAPKVQEGNPTFDWIDLGRQMLFEEGYRIKLSQGQ